ncbi:MAG: hypothetical protein JSU66_08780, partial [Deltaproteobacteria bacterium]
MSGDRGDAPDVFARIRERCAEVMRRARCVRIDASGVDAWASQLAAEPPPAASLDPRHHHFGTPESTLAFVLTLDTINFGSGYFPHLRKRPGLSGYFTIATALKERFDDRGAWTAPELCEMEPADMARALGQDLDQPDVAELMTLFARALRDLGGFLVERYAGRFEGPLEEAAGSAARLVGVLTAMPYFRDVSTYDGIEVPFYKRAQLLCADLDLALGPRAGVRFDDLDRLTSFADNLVPHVLRCDGVLVYAPDLCRRIDAGERIAAGSREEVEIRAGGVHAVEEIIRAGARRGARWSAR